MPEQISSPAARLRRRRATLDAGRSLTLRLHAASDSPLTDGKLRELCDTLEALNRYPSDVGALSAIGRQASLISRVVTDYSVIQGMLRDG
jgi:hypothetical protein